MASDGGSRAEGGQLLKQLVQNLRSDLNLLSTEARKKYPAVREVRGTIILVIRTIPGGCRVAGLRREEPCSSGWSSCTGGELTKLAHLQRNLSVIEGLDREGDPYSIVAVAS